MSNQRRGGTPTEPPSERRVREARRRGEVARSADVVALAVLMATTGGFGLYWADMVGRMREYVSSSLRHASEAAALPGQVLAGGASLLFEISLPLLGALFLAALVANLLQVGALFSPAAVVPTMARLDPVENARRVFGERTLVEFLKTVAKIVGVGWIALSVLRQWAPQLVATVRVSPEQALGVFGQCTLALTVRVFALVIVLASLDYAYQRMSHRRRLRMTREEVRREQKEGEGDPQRKAERQRLHREITEHQMLEAVAQADCVIVNPEHLAVALRYDAASMDAPRVVARGRRLLAAKIREVARQHGVPIVRNVSLARALVDLELDDEIPPALYETVAEVIRFVHGLSRESR